jgi:lysine 2,3-aminomutase
MSRILRSPEALAAAGLIAPDAVAGLDAVAERYAVAVTPAMRSLIQAETKDGPIARQFLPDPAELTVLPEERADPIGDDNHSPLPGLVHRYPDRILLKPIHTCPVYCRFCFRREMVGPAGRPGMNRAEIDAAIAYIAERPAIVEVIITGGDPFMLAPHRLRELSGKLAAIAHVQVVRWHTRVPVVAPERITDALVAALNIADKAVFVGIHANHPSELTTEARKACRRLITAGHSLISQSVLLRGINDDVATLAALMRGFVSLGIKPYYLHHPDLAPGTSHFRLSIEEGLALISALRGHLSGLCQPHYVLDLPGGHGKAPLGPAKAVMKDKAWLVTDHNGMPHPYPPT